jgi:two-component system, OmpR family, sensor histidine kinase VicK
MEATTEILYGNDEITKRTIEVLNSTEKTIEGCIGKEEIRTHVMHQWHMDGLSELRRKGVKVRVVTQVTHDNLPFCKIYAEAVGLRHINGIQSSFGISDGKWLLDHIVSLDEFPLSHAILTT